MSLKETTRHWQRFGEQDPLWAVLTDPSKTGNRWDPAEFFATGRHVICEALAYVERAGANVSFGRALDFGCGVGRLTQALAERFQSVVGVDAAASMIERARTFNHFSHSCEYVLNTSDDLRQFECDSFDFVLSIIVLQHIEPPHALKYLTEFLRVLKPGGVLMFQQTSTRRWTLRAPRQPLSMKQRVASTIPLPLLEIYARVKGRLRGEPAMYAFGIPPQKIVAHIEAHGGKVRDVTPDDWGGPSWNSHHYCVIKGD